MDDVTKTLPVTNPSLTNTPTVDKGSVPTSASSVSSGSLPPHSTSPAPADSNALDQILKDLEKQYTDEGVAKSTSIPVVGSVVAGSPSSSVSAFSSVSNASVKPSQPTVPVKPTPTVMPSTVPPVSSNSSHVTTPIMSSGIRAAIGDKKSSMSSVDIANIKEDGTIKSAIQSSQVSGSNKTKDPSFLDKIGKAKIIVGAVVLVLAVAGLTSGILLSQQSTYNLPKASGPCSTGSASYCGSDCHTYTCDNNQWTQGPACSTGECIPGATSAPGTGDTGGTTGGTNKASCDTCGGANQGGCTGNNVDCNGGRQCDDTTFALCGGGCYPAGWKTCPGQAGCRDPGIACAGSDQCAGVVCATNQYCNGGFCVNNASDTGPSAHPNQFEKFMCPQGCGNDGQCTSADIGATSGFGTASTVISPNECGQIDVLTWNAGKSAYEYSQVKQNTCGSAACQHTPPSSNPPSSPKPPPSSPTPPPSTPPPGAPVCLGIASSISAPQLGQSPVFTCTRAAQATRYEFRWKLGNGAYQSLAPNASGGNLSSPLLVNSSGTYTVQCRPCNATGCANFDNILSIGAGIGEMCGGVANIQCAVGLVCNTGPGPVQIGQSGTCTLENGIR